MENRDLGSLLKKSAKLYPRRVAICFGQKKLTYQTLNEATDRMAAGLLILGIKPKDRVAVLLDNCPHFVISYYSILKAGATVVPVNYMFKMEEDKFILQDCEAKVLITSGPYLDMAVELRLRIDTLKTIISTSGSALRPGINDFVGMRCADSQALNKLKIQDSDLAVILYTSGTTGFPKGAMLTHRNLVSNALDCARAIKATRKETLICLLPLFHSFAATVCMNLPLLIGAKIVLMKSVRPFKRIIRQIRKNKVTVFVGIPSIYAILKDIKLPSFLAGPLLKLINPVRICISGAAALPKETFLGFEKKFRIPLLEGYGLTEASPVVTLNPLKGVRKAGSIGIPLSDNIQLKIVDVEGRSVSGDGVGELLVKGPNVMSGYFKQEGATAEAIKDGWLYTGDMARFDADGYCFIAGRKKEMINVRGLNVYPREIEEVLYHNFKVKEAAVIGIEDAHKGEVPKAFVVLKDGESYSEHELGQYLRERLAGYKIPKHIEFRGSLPKNSTGKILKRQLQEEEAKRRVG